MKNTYRPVIGLEIHVELKTKSKMFCGCPAEHFGILPNSQTCPVCLGLPGALPVPNKKAVEWAILIGLALKCKVNKKSKFDRKHYFYPDLPKGFQISQYDEPLSSNGYLQTSQGIIRIRRVHLEEDTGKLQHINVEKVPVSLVDFNRSGVPLVEIVTEPDIHSASQAKEFGQELQNIIRKLDASNCDMEKGSMRLEANISLYKIKDINDKNIIKIPDYKVEVKNINSFKFLEKSIYYEIERQSDILDSGIKPEQETRGWNEKKSVTISQRYKEMEADYRYFPEPDIPPMEFSDIYIDKIRGILPKLPDEIANELIKKYKIKSSYAQIISINEVLLSYSIEAFNKANKLKIDANNIASIIINQKVDISKINPSELVEKINREKIEKIFDESLIKSWIEKAIDELPIAVNDYKNGKLNAIAVLIGRVMKISKGKADANKVRELLEKNLKK